MAVWNFYPKVGTDFLGTCAYWCTSCLCTSKCHVNISNASSRSNIVNYFDPNESYNLNYYISKARYPSPSYAGIESPTDVLQRDRVPSVKNCYISDIGNLPSSSAGIESPTDVLQRDQVSCIKNYYISDIGNLPSSSAGIESPTDIQQNYRWSFFKNYCISDTSHLPPSSAGIGIESPTDVLQNYRMSSIKPYCISDTNNLPPSSAGIGIESPTDVLQNDRISSFKYTEFYPAKEIKEGTIKEGRCNLSLQQLVKNSTNSKKNELWRPFSPTPLDGNISPVYLNEMSKVDRSLLVPSGVKLGDSKCSVFQPVQRRPYTCSHCKMTFFKHAHFLNHTRVHTGERSFHCDHPGCTKSFSRNLELTRHLRIHSGVRPHMCPECGKRFGRKDHLGKHARTHLGPEEKRVHECSMPGCGHRYTRSDALARHISSVHTPQPFTN